MRADVDHDRVVSILDIAAAAVHFGSTSPPARHRVNQAAPATRDGNISILDIAAMAAEFGKAVGTCPN